MSRRLPSLEVLAHKAIRITDRFLSPEEIARQDEQLMCEMPPVPKALAGLSA